MAAVGQHKIKLGKLGKGSINAIKRFGEDDMLTFLDRLPLGTNR